MFRWIPTFKKTLKMGLKMIDRYEPYDEGADRFGFSLEKDGNGTYVLYEDHKQIVFGLLSMIEKITEKSLSKETSDKLIRVAKEIAFVEFEI